MGNFLKTVKKELGIINIDEKIFKFELVVPDRPVTCVFCLEDNTTPKYKLSCGHFFCTKNCLGNNNSRGSKCLRIFKRCSEKPSIQTWLENHNNCPICRKEIEYTTVFLENLKNNKIKNSYK